MGGYVQLRRSIIDAPFYGNSKAVHLAVHLIVTANHAPAKVLLHTGEVVDVARGQLIASVRSLSKATKLTHQNVRTLMELLDKCQFLTRTSTHHFTLITITKYDTSVDPEESSNTASNTALTQPQHSPNTPLNHKQEDNNVNNKEEELFTPPVRSGPKPKKKEKNTPARLPADLAPTDKMKSYAASKGINGHFGECFEKWLNHHLSKGDKISDIEASFRTWVGNAKQWDPQFFDREATKNPCSTCHNKPFHRDARLAPCPTCGEVH